MIVDVSLGLSESFVKCVLHNDLKDPNILVFNINGKTVNKITDYGGSILYNKKTEEIKSEEMSF